MSEKIKNTVNPVSLVYTKGNTVYVRSGDYCGAFFVVRRENRAISGGWYWCQPLNPENAAKVKLKSFDEVMIQWNEMELCRLPF